MPIEILKDSNIRNECEVGIDPDTMKVILPSDGVLFSSDAVDDQFIVKTIEPLMKVAGIAKLGNFFYSNNFTAYTMSLLGKYYPNSLNRKMYCVFMSKSAPGITNVFDQLENINPLMISINSKNMVEITIMDINTTTGIITSVANNKAVVEIVPDFSIVYDKTLFESIFTPIGVDIKTFAIPFISDKVITANGSIPFDVMKKPLTEFAINQFQKNINVTYFGNNLSGNSVYIKS